MLIYEVWAGAAIVLVMALVLWLMLRWQNAPILRRAVEQDRLRDEKLAADWTTLSALAQKSLDEEAMTRRLVTGIAESLVPTLQYLNVDVKELNLLLHEMRISAAQSSSSVTALIERSETTSQDLSAALGELITLRTVAEGVVVEQSRRLQAIDIALDFLSGRFQDLGHAPKEQVTTEAKGDGSAAREPLSNGRLTAPSENLDVPAEGGRDATTITTIDERTAPS